MSRGRRRVRLSHGAASAVGHVRAVNQDDFGAGDDLFVLADGMGGHRGGEVASAEAVAGVLGSFDERTRAGLARAVDRANQAVFGRAAGDVDLFGMGTTLCALALARSEGGDVLAVANVGDSRVYRYGDGRLTQVSDDHSLVADLVRAGDLTEEEAARHPQRNILTRALGIESALSVDTWELPIQADDRYLLCSDGLFNEIDDDRIAALLAGHDNPELTAATLVRAAVDAGGHDNVTALVVDVDAAPSAQEPWSLPDVKVEQSSEGAARAVRRWVGPLEQAFLSMRTRLGRRWR
ncbi:MAG: protein phosphatase 2C domain-containing protein [Acidimicrobiales bacterium]|nr:protein phosphatase 2C domain-containing protein [Acidimicrobiales bacterium]